MSAIITAVFHDRLDQLRLIGVVQLNDGRRLVGLVDALGNCRYLLDLGTEVIYVLAEFVPRRQLCVA